MALLHVGVFVNYCLMRMCACVCVCVRTCACVCLTYDDKFHAVQSCAYGGPNGGPNGGFLIIWNLYSILIYRKVTDQIRRLSCPSISPCRARLTLLQLIMLDRERVHNERPMYW